MLVLITAFPVFSQDNSETPDNTGNNEKTVPTFILTENPDSEAEPGGSGEEVNPSNDVFSIWDFFKMILVLVLVVAVLMVFLHFLKRTARLKTPDNQMMKIVSSLALQGNNALHLIELASQFYLIGAADQSVSLLKEIDDKETIDRLRLLSAENSEKGKLGFNDLLARLFQPKQSSARVEEPAAVSSSPVEFMKKQQDRLKRLRE
ncbi:MAG: flagellar biosynthetic protein FliO [Spirochaetales bacterium]|nr:flagellar biosynthetic protein FliO [Spirochaetales bacterium]